MPDVRPVCSLRVPAASIGVVLRLVGGGSILAVPLLIYKGVASPHVAICTSAIAVAASALGNLMSHWRLGNVNWRCAAVFGMAGMLGRSPEPPQPGPSTDPQRCRRSECQRRYGANLSLWQFPHESLNLLGRHFAILVAIHSFEDSPVHCRHFLE